MLCFTYSIKACFHFEDNYLKREKKKTCELQFKANNVSIPNTGVVFIYLPHYLKLPTVTFQHFTKEGDL